MAIDNFVLNKGVDNTFTFTIKQNSSTLPMVISQQGTVLGSYQLSYTPSYDVVPETPYIAPVAEVLAQDEVPYVAPVAGEYIEYRLYLGTVSSGVTYRIYIDDEIYSFTSTETSTPYDVITTLMGDINQNTVKNVEVYITANYMYIRGTVLGEEIAVNTQYVSITLIQEAVTPIEEVPYQEAVEYVAPVTEQVYVPEKYVQTSEAIAVDISSLVTSVYSGSTLTDIIVESGEVDRLEANGEVLTPINGVYSLEDTFEFNIIPLDLPESESIPSDIQLTVTVKMNSVDDSFIARIIKNSTGAVVKEVTQTPVNGSYLSVLDPKNGKLSMVLAAELVEDLEVDLRSKADYYYPRPVYRLAIICNTLNNGNFVASIDRLYVR